MIVCICSETFSNVYADKVSASTEKAIINVSMPHYTKESLQILSLQTWPIKSDFNIPKEAKPLEAEKAVQINQNVQKIQNKPITILASTVNQYEVTADSLNIRSDASATSKILKVVRKGDSLSVLNTTTSGWHALKGGGYVNSKYTMIISGSKVQAAEVKILNKKENGEAPHKPSSIIRSDSGLFEAHIKEIFDGTSLADLGLEKAILEIEADYGINAYFTIAVMKLESGYGKSKIAKEKNNLFGLNAIDGNKFNKAFSFNTKGESVQKFGQIISKNYIDKGYTTIEKVSLKYCKANPEWSGLVKTIMDNDYNKL